MKGTARSSDITIPKGVVMCYPISNNVVDADGGIDIGYCQEAEMSITESTRQVFSARSSAKALAVDKVTKTEYSLPLQVMSINADNLAMLFRGQTGTLVQVGGAYDAAGLDVTSPVVLDRGLKLGRRGVSVDRIDYVSGTSGFNVGAQLSSGGATATILWVDGDVASGSLYVARVVDGASEFIDGATLVDDNVAPGAATQSGAVTTINDIVLTDSGGMTRFTLDTDYGIDPKSGTVFFLSTGTITAAALLKAYFDYASLSEVTINAGDTGITEYMVEILPFGDATENQLETVFWKASVKSETTLKLITAGEEEVMIDLTFTPLTDGPGSTAAWPVFRQIVT